MNWTRGLFRLWFFATVAWVAWVSAYVPREIKLVYAPITLHDGTTDLAFPADISARNMKRALVNYVKKRDAKAEHLSASSALHHRDYDAEAKKIMGEFQPRSLWQAMIKLVLFAFSVPAVMLLVGLSIWRVRSTFWKA